MRKIVFDIETRNIFEDVGKADPTLLDISIVGIYDYETNSYRSFTIEELPKLWPLIEKTDVLIGFNSDHFDIPLLNKYYHGDLTKIKSLDLMVEIKKSLGRRIGLANIAEATLGYGKSGHGLQATEWWKKGEIDKIRKYCLQDVKVTKDIYEYALKHKEVKYKDMDTIREIILDTTNWDEITKNAITYSLPF